MDVPNGSAAAQAGLRENDLIQAVNGKAVADVSQFFKALAGVKSASVKLTVVRDQQAMDLTVALPAVVDVESASAAAGFTRLPLPTAPAGTVTANQKVSNSPLALLADGKLVNNYGPIFGNGIQNGAYKMDLGSAQPVAAITSWSYNMSKVRGAQKLTLYGSDSATDPGWDLSRFTPLGTIDTGKAVAEYTAASVRAPAGQTLGTFRWIVWAVAPVTAAGGGENTAFQELNVEVASGVPAAKAGIAAPSPVAPQAPAGKSVAF
jgi:membrane-associated protease RseP (regulator of RpoE activity)